LAKLIFFLGKPLYFGKINIFFWLNLHITTQFFLIFGLNHFYFFGIARTQENPKGIMEGDG
jgi:hypothetical protein